MRAITGKMNGLSPAAREIIFRQWVFELGVSKLDQVLRSSGASMTLHVANVARLLREFNASLETWVAGALHDIEEGYIAEHPADTRAFVTAKLRSWLSEIAQDMVQRAGEFGGQQSAEAMLEGWSNTFISDVMMLISAVTEPPKSAELDNWRKRKEKYLEQIAAGDDRVALLSCATKIDALMNAIKILDLKEGDAATRFAQWSKGTPGENIWLFEQLLEIFREKEICPLALELYEHLLQAVRRLANEAFRDRPELLRPVEQEAEHAKAHAV